MFSDISSMAFNLIYLILGIGNPQCFPEPLSSEEERKLFYGVLDSISKKLGSMAKDGIPEK